MANNSNQRSYHEHIFAKKRHQHKGPLRQDDINLMDNVYRLLKVVYPEATQKITPDCYSIYYGDDPKVFVCSLTGEVFTYAYVSEAGGEVTYKKDFVYWFGQTFVHAEEFILRYFYRKERKRGGGVEVIYLKNNQANKPAKPALNRGEHLLHHLGYDVSTRKALPTFHRQNLLKAIIAIEYIMNKEDVVAHIEANIKRHQHNPKLKRAVIRWQEDLEYIQKTL